MAPLTNAGKAVSFPGVLDVDKAAQLPHCEEAPCAEIRSKINAVFKGTRHGEARDFRVWQKLNSQIEDVFHQLNILEAQSAQNKLSLLVMKAVIARMGYQISLGNRYERAWEYLQITQESQAQVSQLTTVSSDTCPWWNNLEKHWQCFFLSQPVNHSTRETDVNPPH